MPDQSLPSSSWEAFSGLNRQAHCLSANSLQHYLFCSDKILCLCHFGDPWAPLTFSICACMKVLGLMVASFF